MVSHQNGSSRLVRSRRDGSSRDRATNVMNSLDLVGSSKIHGWVWVNNFFQPNLGSNDAWLQLYM